MATIRQLLKDGETALSESDSGRIDAEVLLACALQKTRTWLYTWPDHIPSLPEQHLYLELIRRRQAGEPVAYLTGRREFHNLALMVDHHVLIPRPETEVLVEKTLDVLADRPQARVADLGTGSGAIALAIAREKPAWQITATDCSSGALGVAQENAKTLQIDNIEFVQATEGGWFEPLAGRTFSAIVSNPPYVAAGDPHLEQGDLRFEPAHALISGENGLADIRAIIGGSQVHLEEDGWLLIEHGYEQGEAVRQLFSSAGFRDVATTRDLSGNERMTSGRKGQGT